MSPSRWTLRHHRLQAILAVASIGTAVALPVVLLSVGGGVSQHELSQLESSGYQLSVSAAGVHGISGAHALVSQIESLPNVAAASPVLSVPVDVFLPTGAVTPALAEGVIPGAFLATQGPTTAGLFPHPLPLGDPSDLAHFANGTYAGPAALDVLVASPFALDFGLGVGATLMLGATTNRSAATPFTLTGEFGVPASTLGPAAVFAIVLPLSDLQQMTGFARAGGANGPLLDQADTVEVALVGPAATDVAAITAVQGEVQRLAPFYGVSALTDQANELRASIGVLNGFYLALSSVSLTIGLLFLGLVLVRRVEADRRTIGIRRALGLPAAQIALGLARDGLVLAAAGGVAGVAGGIAVVVGLARLGSGTAATAAGLAIFDPVTLGLLYAGVLFLSLGASAVAARAALRLSIPEALR